MLYSKSITLKPAETFLDGIILQHYALSYDVGTYFQLCVKNNQGYRVALSSKFNYQFEIIISPA